MKVSARKPRSTKIARYAPKSWDIVSVKRGVFRQGAAPSKVFAISLSPEIFVSAPAGDNAKRLLGL